MRCIIGFDDTDSRVGQCTTHLGFRVVAALLSKGCIFSRYPRLVRLNPNIPFKTRGNAAVCLDFDHDRPEDAFGTAESLFRQFSDVEHGANSGAVFVSDGYNIAFFRRLYAAALSGVVNPKKVQRLLKENGIRHSALGNGMGLVGAAASIGFNEGDDHTYEAIAYRTPGNCGTPRVVDPKSVQEGERAFFPHVLSSYDYGSRRVLIAPHGPDPVFAGVRADSPAAALAALEMVRYEEKLAGVMVYLSNQCTDAHLDSKLDLPLSAYSSGWLEGSVESLDEGIGRHLYLTLDVDGRMVGCAIYAPAGDLSRMARRLAPGDQVRVYGGVRRATPLHPAVLNVEKLEVVEVTPVVRFENPACEKCGGATKSEGRGKGFQCRRCGARLQSAKKQVRIPRDIYAGTYLPSPGAQRHLTKQLIRYGREVRTVFPLIDGWLQPEPVRPLRVPVRSPR